VVVGSWRDPSGGLSIVCDEHEYEPTEGNVVKLAESTPVRCSACFGQHPEKSHVDFEAAWDGPVIDAGNGMKQYIDDLVICEDCIRSAADSLPSDEKTLLRDTQATVAALREELAQSHEYARKLQVALATQPAALRPSKAKAAK
jgi:hypothetical protein